MPSGDVRCSRIEIAAETLVRWRNPCMRTSRMGGSGPRKGDAGDHLAHLQRKYHAARDLSTLSVCRADAPRPGRTDLDDPARTETNLVSDELDRWRAPGTMCAQETTRPDQAARFARGLAEVCLPSRILRRQRTGTLRAASS